jgi:hypothetical protein
MRVDLYTLIHKALRALLCETLGAIGRMDASDDAEVAAALGALRRVITLGRHHLHHENQYIHPALEARRRGAACASAKEHTEHEETFERLEALAQHLERSRGAEREAAALELYRELGLHAAKDFVHMHAEETENNAVLWAHYSDAELAGIHRAILASVGPQLLNENLRALAPAVTPSERAALLSGMRGGVPSEEFSGVLELVRSTIGERHWSKLLSALGPRPLMS